MTPFLGTCLHFALALFLICIPMTNTQHVACGLCGVAEEMQGLGDFKLLLYDGMAGPAPLNLKERRS